MDKFLIEGPCKIRGEVLVSGSKNASLPILASTLLFDQPVIIQNLPKVKDIDTMLNLLKSLGSNIASSDVFRLPPALAVAAAAAHAMLLSDWVSLRHKHMQYNTTEVRVNKPIK